MEPKSDSPQQEEIIVLCSVQELTKHFLKDHLLVWHDPNIQNLTQYEAKFEPLCQLKTFSDYKEASSYLQSTDTACSLITSGSNGEVLVRETHDLPNLFTVFVFDGNKTFHQTWAQNYPKVSSIEDDIKQLLSQIQGSIIAWQRQTSSLRTGLPAFAPIFDDSDKSDVDSLHVRLKGLANFTNREQAKRDFVNLAKAIYSDFANMADFEANYNQYNMKTLLNWYTKESFLYKATNKCLRLASTDAIQYCRLILKDLETAIQEQYQLKSKEFSGQVYRGAYLAQDEWTKLTQNVGREIEMYGFLSTTKNPRVAQNFALLDPAKKALITIIVPQGPNEGEQGFAEVKEFSDFAMEEEVLFNVRSIFSVLEASSIEIQGVQCRHLVLLYGAAAWRRHLTQHNPTVKVTVKASSCCTLCGNDKICYASLAKPGGLFCRMCLNPSFVSNDIQPLLCIKPLQVDKTFEVKGKLIKYPLQGSQTPLFYGYKCSICLKAREPIYYKCTDCDEEAKNIYCYACLHQNDHQTECHQDPNHNLLLETIPFSFWSQAMRKGELSHLQTQDDLLKQGYVFQQAETFFLNGEYEKAVEYYDRYIQLSEGLSANSRLAAAYHNLGRVYVFLENHEKSLSNLDKALEMYKLLYGEKHQNVAQTLNTIGKAFKEWGQSQKAYDHYVKATNIWKSLVDHKDRDAFVASNWNDMGDVFQDLAQPHEAFKYYMKALELRLQVYNEEHAQIADSYKKIGVVFDTLAQYPMALKYFEKALAIEKNIYGEKHAATAGSYSDIGVIYLTLEQYDKALEYLSKSLEIKKVVYGPKNARTADCMINIGVIFISLEDYQKALQYFTESLEIYQATYGENHLFTIKAFTNLGTVHHKLKDHEKALQYHEKCLQVYKATYGENHQTVASAYLSLGTITEELEDFDEALGDLLKAYDIYLKICGPDHPYTAVPCSHIAEILHKLGDNEMAVGFFMKSLEIYRKTRGDNHPSVIAILGRIAHFSRLIEEDKKKKAENNHGSQEVGQDENALKESSI